jgi:hypothetical protein
MGLLDSLRGGILGEIETAALPALMSAAWLNQPWEFAGLGQSAATGRPE